MYGFVITTAGEAMLARAAAGEALVLDAVMVGRGVVESAAAAKALNTLIDPVAAATSTAPAVSGNQISMTVEYRNDLNGGLEAGFALSEFGISAHVGDDPAALLYYGSLGDAPQPVKPASEGLDVHRFPVAIAVTGEVSVTLEYPAGGFLTEEDIGGLNYIPTSEKGKPGGVATLGSDGKVSEEQLPKMDYDPAGSAEKVQENLNAHTTDKNNPHGVKAEQVKALPLTGGTVTGPITLPGNPTQPLQAAPKQYVDTVGANAAGLIRSYPIAPGQTVTAGQVVNVLSARALSSYSQGEIVQLKENGVLADFYVASLAYEPTLNPGEARALLVRKERYQAGAWDSGGVNAYAGSDIDTWFNTTYLALLDSTIQGLVGTTTFQYTPGNGNDGVTTLTRAVFALSLTELGLSASYANSEGTPLPIAATLSTMYANGNASAQWTRSPYVGNSANAAYASIHGAAGYGLCSGKTQGFRPIFTLPASTLIVSDGTVLSESAPFSPVITTGPDAYQAIALQSGNAGDTISAILQGAAELSSILVGQQINSPGVTGYGSNNGWVSVFPYWGPKTQIAVGSYQGTGSYGSLHPNEFITNFPVRFGFISTSTGLCLLSPQGDTFTDFTTAYVKTNFFTTSSCRYTKNGLEWYGSSPEVQMNLPGTPYYVFAIG